MKIINLVQGSPEWQAFRRDHNTASEASAMMGASSHLTRNDLLRLKATGDERTIFQGLADRGHQAEAMARAIAERIIGDELFPATGCEDNGKLSASFDGITLTRLVVWENKLWNEEKAALVRAGTIPSEDRWQVMQQLIVSGAKRCLYMVTDGTEAKCVYVWVTLEPADEQALRAGWALFDQDLAAYAPAPVAALVAGAAPEMLSALSVQVRGEVIASNLPAFKAQAITVLSAIKTELQTDEDFANADATTKWCTEVEKRLAGVKQNILGQTASIDEVFRVIDEISNLAREKRLFLEKAVTSRKQAIRDEILVSGQNRYREHMKTLNEGLPQAVLTAANSPVTDFAGVMKGKKSIKSLHDAVDQELARVKLEANALAERLRANFKLLAEHEAGFETLFHDRGTLVFKAADDLVAVVKARITEHKDAEARRALATQTPALPVAVPAAPVATQASVPAAASSTPPSLTMEADLQAWRTRHKVTNAAFATLQALLIRHKVITAQAA